MREGKSIKLKREDTVRVIKGKDRGKTARILRIDRDKRRVIVEGINMVKKAIKPRKQNDKGGIKELEAGFALENVMIVCKKCGPTRIGYKFREAEKYRICRKCGEQL